MFVVLRLERVVCIWRERKVVDRRVGSWGAGAGSVE